MTEGKDFIMLWHGTNKTNFKGILKKGFKMGTWFATDEKTARQYGLMACKRESSLVVMSVAVDPKALYFNGYYCANKQLILKNSIYQ